MFVGGPNTRKDFHMEEGSEFFFQLKGDIELPTLQGGERKVVKIKQGQVYCLPSRIPHSPQRPMENSFGLVIERKRLETEFDGLMYYTDSEKCKKVLWEKFFRCEDLAKDLPPIIKEFKEFESSANSKKPQHYPEDERPSRQDVTTVVPAPFSFRDFLSANKDKLDSGEMLSLFGHEHPDKEFKVMVAGGPTEQKGISTKGDTWLYQIQGCAHVAVQGGTLTLQEGCCCIVDPNVSYDVVRPNGSIGLVVQQDARGNKRKGTDLEAF
jgi:3-hydroxyanthranilate 3,4-dioxygenase